MPALIEEDQPQGWSPSMEPIAICGMACRLPGQIQSPKEFWDLLTKKGNVQTPKVPSNRFNIDAHYHSNLERPGSFNVLGGYFLDGPAENFDPTFFGMSPVEAMWLDPQQRRILEVCYEAIQSAGLKLEDISGSNTGVYMGSFTADYQQMTFKDADFRHSYAATGVDPGIISNRVSNIFDLNGPSFTINTACSSSVYALHNACHALRARDCDAALVGGVNLILTVDQHMNTAKLGVLSPTSFCHTFDARADGYGRGEGAGAFFVKRLSDAIRDGDFIRGVVRGSAVNANGKVPGYGITYPSVKGQELVIRKAYANSGLDPNATAYFECHGTGTPTGDPVEVRAVSAAMNDSRDLASPLIVGAVKPNIGHSEAASGIFAVMKAAMMTEAGVIPGVAGLETINPLIKEQELNVRINRDTREWPKGFDARRASVSSFGYGGTNAHMIVEGVHAFNPQYEHGKSRELALYDHTTSRPLLVTMSSHDSTTLKRNFEAHAKIASQFYLADMAHTLNTRRSRFSTRGYAIASESTLDEDLQSSSLSMGQALSGPFKLGFVFTGQGAQWAGVGRQAINTFSVFRATIRRLDHTLKGLEQPPDFSIEEQLQAPAETSRINDADVSQPALVATQIAIVDLLSSWNIEPAAVVGHSAGEYAASYAAGLLSAAEVIIAAYSRGHALKHFAPSGGSMLAVGKGAADIEPFLEQNSLDLTIACENSPQSVTLSGTAASVAKAKSILDEQAIFCRELRTGMAYHSKQMNSVAVPMVEMVEREWSKLSSAEKADRRNPCYMQSSVRPGRLAPGDIDATYWANNLTSKVLFNTATQSLLANPEFADIKCYIEVGPHSALKGPFLQIREQHGSSDVSYVPTLIRNKDGSRSLLSTAGELFNRNYGVDLEAVNLSEFLAPGQAPTGKAGRPLAIPDLPTYQWNYDTVFWEEPRMSSEYRQLKYARHDLLGSRILGLSDQGWAWRNVLRVKDVPWLEDHALGGSIMFPAAGHMSLAIEAARQYSESHGQEVKGVTFEDFALHSALIVPEAPGEIEIQSRLAPFQSEANKFNFHVESFANGQWQLNSEGAIRVIPKESSESPAVRRGTSNEILTKRHTGKKWNESFKRVGFEYGPSFNLLNRIRSHSSVYEATGDLPIYASRADLIEDESRYILHPSTIDCLLQLCIISIHAGDHSNMPWGVIPVKFEEITLMLPENAVDTVGKAVAWNNERHPAARSFSTDAQLTTESGNVILDIKGLGTVAYEAALPPSVKTTQPPLPYAATSWKPDAHADLDAGLREELAVDKATWQETSSAVMDLLDHKSPLKTVLVVCSSAKSIDWSFVANIPSYTQLNLAELAESSEDVDELPVEVIRLDFTTLPEKNDGDFDLIVLFEGNQTSEMTTQIISEVTPSLASRGYIMQIKESAGKANSNGVSVNSGPADISEYPVIVETGSISVRRANTLDSKAKQTNGHKVHSVCLAYSVKHSSAPFALFHQLQKQLPNISMKRLEDVDIKTDERVIIYNTSGNLLSHLDPGTFSQLEELLPSGVEILWLTAGVNEGSSTYGGMVQGFLRVLREEQKMANITLLDVDKSQNDQKTAITIAKIFAPEAGAILEKEYWLRQNVLCVPRLVPSVKLNEDVNDESSSTIQNKSLPQGIPLQLRWSSGAAIFESDETEDVSELKAGFVSVQVESFEFDPADVAQPVTPPRLVFGTVVQVGSEQDTHLCNTSVLAFVDDPYKTVINVPSVSCIPCDSAKAVDFPANMAALTRVVNIMQTAGGQPGVQHAVLLPSSTELEPMFRLYCQTKHLSLTVAKNDDDLNDLTSTLASFEASNKPFVVVTKTFDDATRSIWASLQSSGRMIVENPSSSDAINPDTKPFNRGASFNVIHLRSLARSFWLKDLMTSAYDILSSALVSSQATRRIANTATVDENDAKVRSVMVYDYSGIEAKIKATKPAFRLSSDAAYLLVGCLGGLGRSLTAWMMERGAKHFVFLSRSGADKPDAARLVADIEKRGAVTSVYRVDASNDKQVSQVVEEVSKQRPIRGVVHAAMVLEDGMWGQTMTLEKFKKSLSPKVDGALALHAALDTQPLDFFIMTSSISATVGQPGQTNYGAANSFLDNLARQRNLKGHPGSSIILPMILGVGVVAEDDSLEEKISRRGMYGVEEDEMLRSFETAMSMSGSGSADDRSGRLMGSAIVMGMDPSRLSAAMNSNNTLDTTWYSDPRFSHLRALVDLHTRDNAGGSGGANGKADAAANAISLATNENNDAAVAFIAEQVMEKCAAILMTPVMNFELEGRSIGSSGLDSMVGAELRNWIFSSFGLNIAFQDLLAPTLSFKKLSVMILDGLLA